MKIDTTKIENYAELSVEDKLKALEDYEIDIPAPKDSDEVTKLKTALSKANGEAAEWKRQYREKQTEAERAEAERAEHEQAIEEELKALRRDKSVSGYMTSCLALGYDKDLAQKAAEAFADNDAAAIMACQQEFLVAKQKEIEMNALNKHPSLSVGAPPTSATAEKNTQNELRRIMGLPPIK